MELMDSDLDTFISKVNNFKQYIFIKYTKLFIQGDILSVH